MSLQSLGLVAGMVYDIEIHFKGLGPEGDGEEQGSFRGYWTGEIDTWGKKTFQPVNGSAPYYLLDREIVSIQNI